MAGEVVVFTNTCETELCGLDCWLPPVIDPEGDTVGALHVYVVPNGSLGMI